MSVLKMLAVAFMTFGVSILAVDAQAAYTDDCVKFSSEAEFSLDTYNGEKNWDGTLWFSTDQTNWSEWNGEKISAERAEDTAPYRLYVRGNTANTKITGGGDGWLDENKRWVLTGAAGIACSGNIETLRGALGGAPSPTPMSSYCYDNMFYGCVALTSAPVLPAIALTNQCYSAMFRGCSSLTNAPALPAMVLADDCYHGMFIGCSSLQSAPALPATNLSASCYGSMFVGCISLTVAPALASTELAEDCYFNMFSDCTSLTNAPVLPALTLAETCYSYMFDGCKSLVSAPSLTVTNLKSACYFHMFSGCTSMTEAPELPATTLAVNCYAGMFQDCILLKCSPKLPATTLSNYCYSDMFSGCTSLSSAPVLSAPTLTKGCYECMFAGCTSLKSTPVLPAVTLADYCYKGMFSGCTMLKVPCELPATILSKGCYHSMFHGCTSLTTVPELPATSLPAYCYNYMFLDCASLEVNEDGPGREWMISAKTQGYDWGIDMFIGTAGTLSRWNQFPLNTTYYIASELPPIPGSESNPWLIGAGLGDTVCAWTNGMGTLVVNGAGKMRDFAGDGADVPWPVEEILSVNISGDVTTIGQNAWHGLGDDVSYNGLSAIAAKTINNGFGGTLYGRISFRNLYAGNVNVQIMVALETSPSLTNEWAEVKLQAKDVSVDTNGHIVITHESEARMQGFYFIHPCP